MSAGLIFARREAEKCPWEKSHGARLLDSARRDIGDGKKYLGTYRLQEDLRVFYIKKLDGLFYLSDRNTIIFLDSMDMRRFHALQMMIPKYLPRLFENSPLSDEETALLKSLGSRFSDEYERRIEQFAQRLDMRGEIIKTRLKGFEKSFEREQAQKVLKQIERYQRDYTNTLDTLRNISNELNDQQILGCI